MLKLYKNKTPKVSVVTATYNRSHLIHKAIESVLNQTLSNIEHIIVDDGSHDDTFAIVSQYMQQDNRIRYIKHNNIGQSLSLNTGLCLSTGQYVCILDSDDYYASHHLQSRVDYLTNHPKIDFVYGGLIPIGSPYVVDCTDPSKLIHVDECSGMGSFFGKTSAFKAIKGFADIVFANDYDLVQRMKTQFNVHKLTEPEFKTIYYVRTEDSITLQYQNK